MNKRGMTLVEVVAATAIMGIAFVSLLSLFTMASNTTADTREKTDMIMIAQGLLEDSCRNEGYAALSQSADGQERDISYKIDQAVYGSSYTAERVLELLPADGGSMVKIVVKVKERESPGYDTGVTLVTMLSGL